MTMTQTTEPTDDAAARAAFFRSVQADVQQLVTDALQQGWTTEQVRAQYDAVMGRAGTRLRTEHGIPGAYLIDILPDAQRIDLLLAAISQAAGAEQAGPVAA